ncbi:sensor histidine kinase [Cohnella mopanensis]|uniref:sensor histidine kinase n=1 Tax=Cohnella mopanensis TaxID=2911966 RepID=UPI001EF94064
MIDNNLGTLISTVEDYSKILATDYRLQNELYNDLLAHKDFSEQGKVKGLDSLSTKKTFSEVISNIVEPNTNIKGASILTANHQWIDVGNADSEFVSKIFGNSPTSDTHFNRPFWTGLINFKFIYEGDDNVFAVSKTVVHKDTGKIIGLVVLYVKESVISSIYEKKPKYKGGEFFILDRYGKIVSSQNKEILYRDFNQVTSISIPDSQDGDTSYIRDVGSQKMLVSINRYEPLQWSIVSVVPLDEITVERKEINKYIMLIGIICLLLALIFSFLLSRSITRPIFQLSKTMRHVRSGMLDVRSSYQSKDEIGYLSDGFNNLMDRIEALMAENVEKQRTKSEVEFKLLQSQVKPHFLYNTVETIISLIKLGMRTEAIAAAKYMADFYKISLSKGNDFISIKEEIQLTESYLEIQQLRYVEYMEYTMAIDDEILKCSIPKLTLQPIVENAIYHGLKRKTEKGLLRITGSRCGDDVIIVICDNGVGMEDAQIKRIVLESDRSQESVSFGAKSVHNRIRMLYGDRYGLKAESILGSYTKVMIRLPFMQTQEE